MHSQIKTQKVVKCRFFVVPGDGTAVLGILDIEVLGILRIMCEVINGSTSRQEVWLPDNLTSWYPKCKTDKVEE